ncbi:MAG TPA: PLP-dependent aspartate aminotransferase family protein [Oligoflexia bacterium]|nr:PLP-dependent aspartate aminotransferase family protein [Oligoflexia bacterium]HMP47544.1 PLP-dependent aspartate aminotransferase family protein [Oligoflexia bacterium]
MKSEYKSIYTSAVHAGSIPNSLTGAVVEPIAQCSVYAQQSPGDFKYDYGRSMNPNYYPLEEALAALEGAKYATVTSSGVGAMTAIITLVKAGDTVILPTDLYGGTYRLFVQLFGTYGVNFKQVDMRDINLVEDSLRHGAQMLYAESPTNPMLQIYDLQELASLSKRYGAVSVMDNTFATPVFQNPLSLGFDAVLHSASKYLGGHSDIVGGAIMTNSLNIRERTDFARKAMGVHLDPLSMFLLRRGIKTLPLRMERHESNAIKFAKYFEGHKKVVRVFYPGLESHPQHYIAKKQMKGFSGMVSIEFSLDTERLNKFVSSFKVITLAESLGAVESLVQIPASMSNKKIPVEIREAHGLGDKLVRFSIGIEDFDDIIEDVEQALARV